MENDLSDFESMMADEVQEAPQTPVDQSELSRLVTVVENFASTTSETMQESQTSRNYYDGKQFTDEEAATLRERKQPITPNNLIRKAINGIVGVAASNEVDPRAYARNGGDEQQEAAAEIATKTLRFISESMRFDEVMRSRCYQQMLIEHACGIEFEWDAEQGKPKAIPIMSQQIIYDPASMMLDFSDARFLGVSRWAWVQDLMVLYPEMAEYLENAQSASVSISYYQDDRPRYNWMDRGGDRVNVITLYERRKGQWMRAVFCRTALLEYGVSPYNDAEGKPACAIKAQSIYIDNENRRYGPIRDMIPRQDAVNKRESKLLHLLNVRQLEESEPGSGVGTVEDARREAARPDGVIPSGWRISPTADMAAGQSQLLQIAKEDFDRLSPNPAVLGRNDQNSSGRAIQFRQQAGMMELWAEFQALKDFTINCYHCMWSMAKQFLTDEQWIRVSGDLDAVEMIKINEPIVDGMRPEQDPQTGQVKMVPNVVGYHNRIADIDADIVVDVTPNTAVLQQEQYAMLVEMVQAGIQIPPMALIQASSLPNKRELLEAMKPPEQAPAPPNPMQEQIAVLTIDKAKADIRKLNADASKSEATAMQTVQSIAQSASMPPPGFSGDASGQDVNGQIVAG